MITPGSEVNHSEFGTGRVVRILGELAQVDFFGEILDVSVSELELQDSYCPEVGVDPPTADGESIRFRQAIEAMNLGVVPPDPSQLIELTIGGCEAEAKIVEWLGTAQSCGLCKVFFGYYGSGKTHHLQLIKATSLKQGWVTAYLEFDPKTSDPAKPHLVYQGILNGLTFPKREDGTVVEGFFGLVEEIRNRWDLVRGGYYFQRSPWFRQAMEILQYFPHSTDEDYVSGVGWLSGQVKAIAAIRNLARRCGRPAQLVPMLPRIRETADIYVFLLVVLNEICRNLGYSGLAIIIDEAEHVRGFNVRRRERANNLLDILARTAHLPLPGDTPPLANEHGMEVPHYWKEGPHFALFVGLTEGEIFVDPRVSLREACVFIHQESDRVFLTPPLPNDYLRWCELFWERCHRHLGSRVDLLGMGENRRRLGGVLSGFFEGQASEERVMRIWVKLASLVPSILMCGRGGSIDDLVAHLSDAARKASGNELPWD